MAKTKAKSLIEAIDELEKQAMGSAAAIFASVCEDFAKAAYGAIVSGYLTETCLTQHNSKLYSENVPGGISGKVLMNSKGANAPILDVLPEVEYAKSTGKPLIKRSFIQRRVSNTIPSSPENVHVVVNLDTSTIARAYKARLPEDFAFAVGTKRFASEEAHIREFLEENGLDDVDITAIHAVKFSDKARAVVPGEFARRFKPKKLDTATVKAVVE